jgi:hypothetical protein
VKFFYTFIVFIIFVTSVNAVDTRLDTIKKTGKLRVCVWPEYYGISYVDKGPNS